MKRHLPPGMPEKLDYPDCSVGDILASAARRYPDKAALIGGDLRLTYAELYDLALRCAQGLRERGIRPGDVVALHQPNSTWFTVGYYGVVLAGAVVTPVNPTLPPLAVRNQLVDAGAVAAITHPSSAAGLGEIADSLDLVVTVPAESAEHSGGLGRQFAQLEELLAASPEPATPRSGDDLVHLAFTGGTTGRSKAVRVLHRNVVRNTIQSCCWRSGSLPRLDAGGGLYLEPHAPAQTTHTVPLGTAAIGVAPMFHAMGLNFQNVCALTGATLVLPGRLDPAQFLRDVERYGVTNLLGAPTLFHALIAASSTVDADLTSVRLLVSGAAPNDSVTLGRLRKVFPNAHVVEGYGLTEATMGVSMGPVTSDDVAPVGSIGVPFFDTEVVIREFGGLKELPQGETGEVWVRGPQVTDGYHGHPEPTAEQFREGWLNTGDVGYYDQDGWIFLVGREKDMLLYKGYNVYPGPLEDLLHQHPSVALATVIGAPKPGVGEIPVAYVVTRPGHAGGPELAAELMDFVAARVAPYQKVREVHFSDVLPTSTAGKILKTELRRRHTHDVG
ncbi:class I adenylate-forming enzyme family protein [Streptomyces sp. NPDC056938]|uniref:class I adenylate-forming enzyme family protein n=1 Tax=unclassified Streptomyces TaxID=2593676 RepID=UPI0036347B83